MHMQRGTVNRDRREVAIVISLLMLVCLLGTLLCLAVTRW
jgi:hypothetical protein